MNDGISYVKRFSYAASDTAGQFVFCVISFYISYFYTDVVGLSAAAAANILLIARFTDAVDAPVWGIIFDKTRSRYGKSRPWFLWLCGPFAIFGVLTFLAPNLGSTAKALYAGGTYIVCSILYTGINTPVTSILSALTPDPRERVILTCYRMFGSKMGVLLVNLTAFKLVTWLGHGNDKRGFMLTMLIFAACSALLYLLAFRNLKESAVIEPKPLPIKSSFRAVVGNWPWLIIFASCLFFWIAFISRIQMVTYFLKYNWQGQEPFLFLSHEWTRKELISLAYSLDVVSLASIFLIPWFCKFTSKRNVWLWGLLGSVMAQFVVYAGASMQSLPVLFLGWIAGILASGVALALPFSLLSDSVDYGEWKTGIRAVGLLTAVGAAFCLKAGSGLGGAIPLWIMDRCNYVANAVQSAKSLQGIEISFIWIPALFYTLSLIPVLFYQKFERLEPQIQRELSERRTRTQ